MKDSLDFDFGDDWKSSKKNHVSCYVNHPALKVGEKFKIYGGSASNPVIKDADIYVALQAGSSCDLVSDPWEEDGHVVEIHYPISDQHAPKNVSRFKKMIDWLCNQLQAGKKIHVGCIGGHGRTGIVLAAIVAKLGEKDAIVYVRKHYCKKAVESHEQVNFLVQHYGVKSAQPRHSHSSWSGNSGFSGGSGTKFLGGRAESGSRNDMERFDTNHKHHAPVSIPHPLAKGARTFAPMASSRCLWNNKKEKK